MKNINKSSSVNYQEGAVVSKEILKTSNVTITLFAFLIRDRD
jgi:hypothetical protein